jgi:flavorubredoxin
MKPRLLRDNVLAVGAVDWDRRLFDALIPLPDGTSYNAYLVRGRDKTALIDTVEPTMLHVLMENLESVAEIDYVVCLHVEQDHSGSIPQVLAKYPRAIVLCSDKAEPMLVDHLLLPEGRLRVVKDGETVELGGKTLEFIYTPWVHWPETMCSYLREDRILFSCDFFGSHDATSELFVREEELVVADAKRYYAEIMMPFRTSIKSNIAKVETRPIDLIAPSHGPVYPRPSLIIDAYKEWISDLPRNEAVIPYVTMHGSTAKMVEYLVDALVEQGVRVQQFNMAGADIGKLAMSLVDAATLIIGTPAVHVGAHPQVAYAAMLANALRPKLRFASVVGSYGWAAKPVEQIAALIPNLKVELLPPVLAKGYPKEGEFKALDGLAEAIAARHRALNLA